MSKFIKINVIENTLFSIITFMCFWFCSFASLATPQDRPVMDLLNEAIALRSSDYQRSILLYHKLRDRQSELTNKNRLELIYLEGYLQMMQGDYDGAIKTHSNLTMVKDSNLALRAYSNMLIIELLDRDYLSASTYLVPILEIIKANPINLKLSQLNLAYEIIGTFYNHLADYESALFYLNKVVPNAYNDREKCNFSAQILKTKVSLDLITTDAPEILKEIEFCGKIYEPIIQHGFMGDLASELISRKHYKKVIALLLPKVAEVNTTAFKMNQAEFYSFLALSLQNTEQYELARQYALKATLVAENLPERRPYKLALEVLYQQAKDQGKEQDSYDILQKLIVVTEAYKASEQLKFLALEQAKFDFMDLTDDIQKYNQKVSLENKLISKKTKTNKIFSMYVFLERLIYLALLSLVIYQAYTLYKEIKSIRKEKNKLILDKTTKALNRNIFIDKAFTLLKKYKDTQQPVAFILFDIDKFRQINHIQGNDRADRLLKTSLKKCLAIIPNEGLLGRLGGDEFMLTLPGYTAEEAKITAESLRHEFTLFAKSKGSIKVKFTASFGITDTILSGYEFFNLIIDTDTMVQKIKKEGGDDIKVFNQIYAQK